ncbi:MAG TPA: DUF2283 domain-containing protein [Stellaceae bacterium]|nr:DUF2283 domain-containing protein [Stellaceae bacterium]
MIRTHYDPEADILHIAFGPPGVRSDTSEEVAPGVFVSSTRTATRSASRSSACGAEATRWRRCKRLPSEGNPSATAPAHGFMPDRNRRGRAG